jgi:hypothetical protein
MEFTIRLKRAGVRVSDYLTPLPMHLDDARNVGRDLRAYNGANPDEVEIWEGDKLIERFPSDLATRASQIR